MTSIPFVVGGWVRGERFYGRHELIDEVLDGPRHCLWVVGTRRIGKTSLLKQLEHLAVSATEPRYCPLFWDFQGAEDSEELRQSFYEALLDAEDRLGALGIGIDEVNGHDLFVSLGKLRRKLRGMGLKMLLLCDEVEELLKVQRADDSFLRKLRRALQSDRDMRSVLASTIRLWGLSEVREDTSPFLHGLAPPLYINQLSAGEASALIRQDQLPAELRPRLDETAIETIRTSCDDHPYLIQLVCKRFVEQPEMDSLDEVIQEVGTDSMVRYFFSIDFESLSETERDVVRLIATTAPADSKSLELRIGVSPDRLGDALQRLEGLGYIRRTHHRRFALANHFFRRWLDAQTRSEDRVLSGSVRSYTSLGPTTDDLGVLGERYELQKLVGEGAVGVVYRARDRALDQWVAVKVLRPAFCDQKEALARFHQEIVLARDLAHPNIVNTYDLGYAAGQSFLTMQWIGGGTVATEIERNGALGPTRTVDIARRIAGALEAAHGRNVIHRDVKPQNILINESGEPFLSDFGLARLLDGPSMTRSGVFLGTPGYASPEQAEFKRLNAPSDLYSLGVVIFEMATGRKPFVADSVTEVLEMHRSVAPPDPRTICAEVDEPLADLILKCLQKNPADRPTTARHLRLALEEIQA